MILKDQMLILNANDYLLQKTLDIHTNEMVYLKLKLNYLYFKSLVKIIID